MRERIRIFKDIPELDAQIRIVENPDDKDPKENYYIVEVGLCESIGEQGYNYTIFYDNKPTDEEIIKDIKEHIKEQLEDLNNKILSGREESYLKIFNKLEKRGALK